MDLRLGVFRNGHREQFARGDLPPDHWVCVAVRRWEFVGSHASRARVEARTTLVVRFLAEPATSARARACVRERELLHACIRWQMSKPYYKSNAKNDPCGPKPGLFEVAGIQKLASELGVDILAKVVFSFTPDILLSPLALPRDLLDKTVDRLLTTTSGALADVLLQLKIRPTFEEQWPDQWQEGLVKGKRRVLKLEKIRGDEYTLSDILSQDSEIAKWYEKIIT